jgi:hypothetical protein
MWYFNQTDHTIRDVKAKNQLAFAINCNYNDGCNHNGADLLVSSPYKINSRQKVTNANAQFLAAGDSGAADIIMSLASKGQMCLAVGCFIRGKGTSNPGGNCAVYTGIRDPAACQKKCQEVGCCQFWNYHTGDTRCVLKFDNGTTYDAAEVVSGPKYCDASANPPADCDLANGWTYAFGSCWKINHAMLTWNQAIDACAAGGGRLARVVNEDENRFIAGDKLDWPLATAARWIGATCDGTDWIWIADGKKLNTGYFDDGFDISGCKPNECLQLVSTLSFNTLTHAWQVLPCDGTGASASMACQKRPTDVTPVPTPAPVPGQYSCGTDRSWRLVAQQCYKVCGAAVLRGIIYAQRTHEAAVLRGIIYTHMTPSPPLASSPPSSLLLFSLFSPPLTPSPPVRREWMRLYTP